MVFFYKYFFLKASEVLSRLSGNENYRRTMQEAAEEDDDALYRSDDANYLVSKVLGKPRGTKKKQREFAARQRQRMAERAGKMSTIKSACA